MNFSDPQHVLTVLRLLISIDYISLSPHDPVSHLGDDDNGVQAADDRLFFSVTRPPEPSYLDGPSYYPCTKCWHNA